VTRPRLFRVRRRLRDHADMLADHHAELGDHDAELADHEERLTALERWVSNPDRYQVPQRALEELRARRQREEANKERP
jgi:hypothetical protein